MLTVVSSSSCFINGLSFSLGGATLHQQSKRRMCSWLKSLSGWCQEVGEGEHVESHTQGLLTDLQAVTTGWIYLPCWLWHRACDSCWSSAWPVRSIAAMTFLWLVDWGKGGRHKGLKWKFSPHLQKLMRNQELIMQTKGRSLSLDKDRGHKDVSPNRESRRLNHEQTCYNSSWVVPASSKPGNIRLLIYIQWCKKKIKMNKNWCEAL